MFKALPGQWVRVRCYLEGEKGRYALIVRLEHEPAWRPRYYWPERIYRVRPEGLRRLYRLGYWEFDIVSGAEAESIARRDAEATLFDPETARKERDG